MLIYVTGVSAAGKSSILSELRRRGFDAVGTDEDGYGRFVFRNTEQEVPPRPAGVDSHEWHRDHAWVIDAEKVDRLAERTTAEGKLTFLCGVASGDDRVWKSFDLVCALVIDDDTILARAAQRAESAPHHFGGTRDELKRILEWNDGLAEAYRDSGAVIIDATQPLAAVVDDILDAVERRKGE